jgi:predicted MFS family arabinose efflux permease
MSSFTTYQKLVLLGLGGLLFTVVLNFMLLPALSSNLMEALSLTTTEFGMLASAYALSAGVSAFISSGFADRFDRRRYLLFFYLSFLLGILLCGLSRSFQMLLLARVITGTFGGVVASIAYAIVTDIFKADQRGRAMGYLQVAFALGLVAGLPLTLYLASQFSWQWGYACIFLTGLGFIMWLCIYLQPLTLHLQQGRKNVFRLNLKLALLNQRHGWVYLSNTFIVFGDVLFMTFFAAYCTRNLGIFEDKLPILYGVGGLATLASAPLIGKLTDRVGHIKIFLLSTALAIPMIGLYSLQPAFHLWTWVVIHSALFLGITGRMVTSASLATKVPQPHARGAFMSLDASIQQLAAGVAAVMAGWVVIESVEGPLLYFNRIGWLVIFCMVISVALMRRIQQITQVLPIKNSTV